MTTRTLKRLEPDIARIYGAALAMAWCKYQDAFGDVPHGSLDQMTALVELAGGENVLVRVAAHAQRIHAQRKGAKRKGRR